MRLITLCSALCLVAAILGGVLYAAEAKKGGVTGGDTLAYVGTYTAGKSKGIYLFRLQEGKEGATLAPLGLAAETPSPSFLVVDAKRRLLFAVNETNQFEGKPGGGVSAFTIEATGKLTLLNQKSTTGTGPCHLMLSPDGRSLLIANYNSGSVAVIRVEADGHLGDTTAFVQHAGSGADPSRQKGPHAHCITFDPSGRLVFVCDLGLDRVMAYRFDAAQGKLTPAEPAFTALKPGSGPRHMVFRPDGKFAYVVNELNSTVAVFAYEAGTARLTEVQSLSTLPAGFAGNSSCAEIQVHPSGKFLYASNRGHDSLAVYAVDPAAGTLKLIENHPTGGKTPRHFGFDPSGQHVIAANQNTDNLQISALDAATGRLKASSALIDVPSPVCVVFLPPQQAGR